MRKKPDFWSIFCYSQGMSAYLTRKAAEKLRRGYVFFLAVLLLSGWKLKAQDFSSLSPEESRQRRAEFIDAAMQYLGVPYVSAGTTRRGMDCSGFVFRAAADALGASLPRSASGIAQYAEKIPDEEREPGDLVFFSEGRGISHVGIYIGEGKFVNSASRGPRRGVIVSSLSESYWRRTYRFSGRILPPAGNASAAEESGEAQAEESAASETVAATETAVQEESPLQPKPALPPSIPEPEAMRSPPAEAQEEKSGLRFELRGTALWDFDIEERLIRGTTATVTAQWRGRFKFYPGIAAGFSWDLRHDTMAVPVYLSVTAQNGLGFFVGAQIIFYSGGEASADIMDTVFPGIVGVSWTSPYKELGAVKIGFYQSIECVFVRNEGVAGEMLSDEFRLSTGVSLAIGN